MGHVVIEEAFTKMGLSATEMIALGIIYGFSQSSQGVFYGSHKYLAGWLGCTEPTVIKTMKRLVEAGLVEKGELYDGGVRRCAYRYIGADSLNCFSGKEILVTPLKNLSGTPKKSLGNTLKDNIDINKTIKDARVSYGDFVSMTEAEYQKLVDMHGREDAERMIEILNNYKGATGKKYKSDYLAILNWVVGRLAEEKARQFPKAAAPAPKRESPVVAMMRSSRESFQRIVDRHADDQTKEVES